MTLVSRAIVFIIAVGGSIGVARADTLADLIEGERRELSRDCQSLELRDDFATEVDVNGDDLPDVSINYGRISCDGSQMMYCGTAGCSQKLLVQQEAGRYVEAASFYVYEFTFDRPEEASFVAAQHGSACGRSGVETCYQRFRWDGAELVFVAEVTPPGPDGSGGVEAPPHDRWAYLASLGSAAIGPDQDQLSLTCESGAIRIRYSAPWMFDGGEINDFILTWDADSGAVASFDMGGRETDIPVRLVEADRRLVALDTIALDAPLLDELARSRRLTIHHGGSLEFELGFALAGSGAAIRALRDACG